MAIQITLRGSAEQKKNVNAELPLYIRYSHNGKEAIISTKKKIASKYWDDNKERPKTSYPGGPVNLSRYLTNFKGEVERAVTDLQNEGREPEPSEVKQRFAENTGTVKKVQGTVLGLIKQYLLERSRKNSPLTSATEKSGLFTFEEFLESIGKTSITLAQLDHTIVNRYDDYLSRLKVSKGLKDDGTLDMQPLKLNTKGAKLKYLKAFLLHHSHPAAKQLKPEDRPGDKVYLTLSERAAMEAYDFSSDKRLERARDMFALQCRTGLRISDLSRLHEAHFTEGVIHIRTHKNNNVIKFPITPSIRAIFEKYSYHLPVISDQRFNDYIKEVAKTCLPNSKVELTEYRGGEKLHKTVFKHEVLSSHCAVRTFITLSAQAGMPIPSIAYLTGKTVAIILRNYLAKDEEAAQADALKYDFSPLQIVQKGA